jgi:predicted O-methyltransferase YrrM
MNALLERIYRSGEVEDADGHRIRCSPVGVTLEAGTVLYDLIRATRPERTLEIGLAYGVSALFICQAHRDNGTGRHTAIDPFEQDVWQSIGVLNIERAGLSDLFRFLPAPSFEVLPQLYAGGERFDFALIDGSHLFDDALIDFFYIDKLLTVGGHVVFDDLWMPGVRKVVAFVLRNRAYRLVRPSVRYRAPVWKRVARVGRRILQDPFGRDVRLKLVTENVGVLTKTAEDARPWDHHRSF